MNDLRRKWLLAGGSAVLAVALAVVVWLGWSDGPAASPRSGGPLAVVLMPDIDSTRLVVVDLRTAKVVRRIALRSLATDIALEVSTGIVVGAQAGGLGADADHAASLTDPRTGQVRYVELAVDDPGDVVCAGGRAFLQHSTQEVSGTVFSVVDVAKARPVGLGHVPGPPALWASAAGAVWTSGEASGKTALRRIDPVDLTTEAVGTGVLRPRGVADVAGGPPVIMGVGTTADATIGAVAPIGTGPGGTGASVAVTGLPHAPRIAARVGDRLVVGDWNGEEPESRWLRMLDPVTLEDRGALPVDGVPCALATWGDRLVAVDRKGGRLLVIDPVGHRTISVVDLGQADPVFADVVVVQ